MPVSKKPRNKQGFKRSKKMPAAKLLHQQSEANTKPEYILGHSLPAVSLLKALGG